MSTSMRFLQLTAGSAGFALPGCWTLARDRAIKLDTRDPGYLRVAHGAVWATLDGPHEQGQANEWGDVVLRCGARIRLVPGQQVVLEPYPDAANEDACFSWEPDGPVQQTGLSRAARVWRWLRGIGTAVTGGLGQWLEPGPGWPRHREDFYQQTRDQALRRLYHLSINQP